ncbi:uclacyanin 1-like [Argentina anserina]|uniref:uclacyanin 1-like n=1 Tax=Argentina anserina TaxID=57926 RepID=UPI00217621F1|nr:uclacyanin 1-like [Potentilla anserina]
MAFRSNILLLFVALALCGACAGSGVVHRVGGPEGWVVPVNYNQWSASKEFHVGDSLLFSYLKSYHNVMEVTEQAFKSCNSSSPIATYDSGSDTIMLTRPGRYYFLCGAPNHCDGGQKVQIVVSLPKPDSPVSSPRPTPSGLSSPPTPSPAPSRFSSPSTQSPAPSSSTPHPQEKPPTSAALTINAPKLALGFGSVLAFCNLMF